MSRNQQTLKLGKGAVFVKSRLRRLPQGDDVWEADIRPVVGPRVDAAARIWLGLVVETNGVYLTERTFEEPPAVNDMARLLADAMGRPFDEYPRRPKVLRLRARDAWRELVPHLEQLGIRVVWAPRLAKWDAAFKDASRRLLALEAAPRPPAVEALYPSIAEFVQTSGWIEIGDQEGLGFVAMALDYGGLAFEAKGTETLAEAMSALEKGLAEYLKR